MGRKIASFVECRAGYSGCDHPQKVLWPGQNRQVKAIIAEWRTPVEKHYRLLCSGDLLLATIYNETRNTWKVEMI